MKQILLVTIICVMLSGTVVLGDWSEGDPAKWVQLPDLSPLGMDVLATHPKVLADDFLCTSTDPITDIHIWGSWLWDQLPYGDDGMPDPGAVAFRLSIHSDIPAIPNDPDSFSRPGDLLWERVFKSHEFKVRPYSQGPEGWFDPNSGYYEPVADNITWQYNFFMDPLDTSIPDPVFYQKGTPTDPVVYWLDVEAFPEAMEGAEPLFGWKTAREHWNDDAVFADWVDEPPTLSPWRELLYPPGHPYYQLPPPQNSIDLAFAITPEPSTIALLVMGGLALLRRKRKI